jgi:DNA-binding SARP family transcriptional activator
MVLPPGEQRVLAFLGLAGGFTNRSYLAGRLWFETSESHAHACLRSTLWRLRHCCATTIVDSSRTHVRLRPTVSVDVQEQIALARRLLDPDACLVDGDARSRLEGELLPGWYDEWVLLERTRLHQLRLHALEAFAGRLIALGRYGEAVDTAFSCVLADPLRESARRLLINAFLAEGNRADAIRQYREYRELVRRKLGVEPSPELLPDLTPASG